LAITFAIDSSGVPEKMAQDTMVVPFNHLDDLEGLFQKKRMEIPVLRKGPLDRIVQGVVGFLNKPIISFTTEARAKGGQSYGDGLCHPVLRSSVDGCRREVDSVALEQWKRPGVKTPVVALSIAKVIAKGRSSLT